MVEELTSGFDLDCDLRVIRSSPKSGSAQVLLETPSLSPTVFSLSLSLKEIYL